MSAVAAASLYDMRQSPAAPADPDKIKVVSGLPGDNRPIDNADATDFVRLIPDYNAIQLFIEAAPDAAIGSQYRLNLAVSAEDCAGRIATMRDCVMILVTEC